MIDTTHIIYIIALIICIFSLGIVIRNIIRIKKSHQPLLKTSAVNASPQQHEALIGTLTGHQEAVQSLAFNPDGTTLASGSYDGDIILWDVKSMQTITRITNHDAAVRSVTFSPDGKTFASASDDKTIKLWNIESYQLQSTFKDDQQENETVAFTSDGQTFLSYSYGDKIIKLWEVATGQLKDKILDNHYPTDSAIFNPYTNSIASSSDQRIILWDIETKSIQKNFTAHEDDIACLGYSANGQQIASSSWDNTIKIWDSHTGMLMHTINLSDELNDSPEPTTSIAFSPNGELLAFVANEKIVIWNIRQHKILALLTGHEETNTIFALEFSPDGNTLVSGSEDCTIKLWDVSCLVKD